MADRKTLWTILALGAIATALTGWADTVAEDYAERALKRALVTFAAARTLNGVISVVQSTEVGVGVTVAIGEVLDPINDLVERFSAVMLVAASSLGLQNVLLNITASAGVTALLVIGAVSAIVMLWWPGKFRNKAMTVSSRILIVVIAIRFLVPLLIMATNLVTDVFLTAEQVEATAALEGTSSTMRELNEELEASTDEEQSLIDRLGSMIDESLESIDIAAKIDALKENATMAAEHIVQLIVLFVLQTIILPLAILWLLVELLKRAAGRLMEKSI